MAGVIALAAMFMVATVEMIFSPGRSCCTTVDLQRCTGEESSEIEDEKIKSAAPCCTADSPCKSPKSPIRCPKPTGPMYGRQGLSRSDSIGQILTRMSTLNAQTALSTRAQIEEAIEAEEEDVPPSRQPPQASEKQPSKLHDIELGQPTMELSASQKRQKQLLQCLLLEIGILFHSVFIGMALAVAIGNDFLVLLIAIAFHQTFEGLALGSRIASVGWGNDANKDSRLMLQDRSSMKQRITEWQWRPWLMAVAYGLTTPIGQVIGIATHTLYAPDSMTGLLMVGIMNAISAGLLTFTSLIDLLSEDFLSDESWRTLRGRRRLSAWALVFAGAFGMSLIGAWA